MINLFSATAVKKELWELDLSLFEQIELAKAELARLYDRFNFESDPARTDELIYQICAAEAHYRTLIASARDERSEE